MAVKSAGPSVSAESVAAVNDCANGLGFAGRLKFSEVDPLRADAVDSLLGVKLNDGVLEVLGGDAAFALELEVGEVASEVVVGASGLKLGGAACDCFVLSSGLANVNGLLDLAGSLSGAFGAANVGGLLALIVVSGAFGAANVNGLLAVAGSVSVAFGAANEKEGSAGLLFGGAGGEVMAGKALTGGELLGEESPASSTNGPAGLGG